MIHIRSKRRKTPDISMAPLVDCMLLLLVFFLLTSSFSEKQGIDISLPQSSTAQVVENDFLRIEISESGEIRFKDELVEIDTLSAALMKEISNNKFKQVLLVGDKNVSLEKLTELIDCVKEAGVHSVSIATKVKKDTP